MLAVELAAAWAVVIRRRTHHGPLMSIQLVPRLLLTASAVGSWMLIEGVDHGTNQPTNKQTNKIECVRVAGGFIFIFVFVFLSLRKLGIISIKRSYTRTIFVRSFFSY